MGYLTQNFKCLEQWKGYLPVGNLGICNVMLKGRRVDGRYKCDGAANKIRALGEQDKGKCWIILIA